MNRHLLKVTVAIRNGGTAPGGRRVDCFTGKLVKSLVIDGNPRLKRFFEKSAGAPPKLIHVTPLYVESSRVKCVHSLEDVVGGRYAFYVGFVEARAVESPSFDGVYTALTNISGRHRFMNRVLDAELVSLETVDIDGSARSVAASLAKTGKLRVIFSSPALLRDPFRAGKHKSLIPTPMNVFSTPVYVNLYLTGRLRRKPFIKTLLVLHRVLNEPYSVYKTAKVIKVRYEDGKNPIPALIGYVNLFLNRDYRERYSARGVDIDALLEDILTTALAIGVGTSRATGFGHVTISAPSGT